VQLLLSHFSLHEALRGDFSVWMFIRPLLAKLCHLPSRRRSAIRRPQLLL